MYHNREAGDDRRATLVADGQVTEPELTKCGVSDPIDERERRYEDAARWVGPDASRYAVVAGIGSGQIESEIREPSPDVFRLIEEHTLSVDLLNDLLQAS